MNRHSSSLRPVAAAAAMSFRPHQLRGIHQQGWRGYCDKPSDSEPEFVSGDSHFRAVRDANSSFRPTCNAVPPPQYFPGQQFHGPRPGTPNLMHSPGPGPYRHPPQVGPAFGDNHQFRPRQTQQQFRPRPPKPPDYREWESATSVPSPNCERFKVLSYNILADYLAIDHRQNLYFHIPSHMLDWTWRRRSITFELGLWSSDILCFQEVDRFQDIEAELKHRGYSGIWKMRTGDPVDGCAIFWRISRFKLLHEESLEYDKFGLRNNVAQICVFESVDQNNTNGVSSLSESSTNHNRVVVCNIHVLFNPKRGEIKLGQIRLLLDRAHSVSKLWDDAPLVICGDFNCTPKSHLYNFITERKLDLSELPRDKISGQASAELRPPRPTYPNFRTQYAERGSSNGTLTGTQNDSGSRTVSIRSPSSETISLEPYSKDITSKEIDPRESVDSKIEILPDASDASQPERPPNLSFPDAPDVSSSNSQVAISGEIDIRECAELNIEALPETSVDNHSSFLESSSLESKDSEILLEENYESLSLDVLLTDEAKNEANEDCDSFLSELHKSDLNSSSQDMNSHSYNEILIDGERLPYNPSAWTPMEIETATGSANCTVMEHPLKLTSSYTEIENTSGLRDSCGEPLVTSYHRRFLGTVDYIWHSEGLQTARVLAPIPKHVMQQTRGFPTKKWGSDHIALVSEFAFSNDTSSENTSQ